MSEQRGRYGSDPLSLANAASTMGQPIETLARFAAQTQWEDIPVSVREHAKRVLLDTIGVILAGSVRPEVVALRDRLAANSGAGATVYAPGAPVHDARTAALLNGSRPCDRVVRGPSAGLWAACDTDTPRHAGCG